MNNFNKQPACLALSMSNDLGFIKSEVVVCVQAVYGWEVGNIAVAYRRFVLCHPGFQCGVGCLAFTRVVLRVAVGLGAPLKEWLRRCRASASGIPLMQGRVVHRGLLAWLVLMSSASQQLHTFLFLFIHCEPFARRDFEATSSKRGKVAACWSFVNIRKNYQCRPHHVLIL